MQSKAMESNSKQSNAKQCQTTRSKAISSKVKQSKPTKNNGQIRTPGRIIKEFVKKETVPPTRIESRKAEEEER